MTSSTSSERSRLLARGHGTTGGTTVTALGVVALCGAPTSEDQVPIGEAAGASGTSATLDRTIVKWLGSQGSSGPVRGVRSK